MTPAFTLLSQSMYPCVSFSVLSLSFPQHVIAPWVSRLLGCAESCLTIILSLSDPRHAYLGNLGTTEVNNSIVSLLYFGKKEFYECVSLPLLTIENLPVLRRRRRIRPTSLFQGSFM